MYEQGFTLIELMITLAVLAIIISLAAPSFVTMIQNNRATGATNDLVASFQLARTEAIKRNGTVLIKKKNGAGTRNCSGVGDWACGHLIGVDLDSDGSLTGAELLRDVKEPHLSIDIDSDNVEISYNGSGGVTTATTFTIDSSPPPSPNCDPYVKKRTIQLGLSGSSTLTVSARACS